MIGNFERVDHRPWPMPDTPWLWRQRWTDLLFIHWPVPAAVITPLIPRQLRVDLFDGVAWLSLVPFRLSDLSIGRLPAAPWLSHFSEMNLRTYVTDGQRPGVWFFRMDCTRVLAVLAARATLGLPYVWSRMRVNRRGDRVRYHVRRQAAEFRAEYGPNGAVEEARPGSVDYFLAERYCLYSRHRGGLLRGEIHHGPWPLQPAAVSIHVNTIPASLGLPAASATPRVHFSARQDVIGWSATRLS